MYLGGAKPKVARLSPESAADQCELFRTGQPFDRRFPPERLRALCARLAVNHLCGQARPGILGSCTAVMHPKALLQIGGPSGVEGSISAPQDINPTIHPFSRSHSAGLNPTSTSPSPTTSGRLTNIPLVASRAYCSASSISGSFSFSPCSL